MQDRLTNAPRTEQESLLRRRILPMAGVTSCLVLLLLGAWGLGVLLREPTSVLRMALSDGSSAGGGTGIEAAAAAHNARLAEIAYADALARHARDFAAAAPGALTGRVMHFTGVTQSLCADAGGVSGPFFCLRDRTAGFDAQFTDALRAALRADADAATALMAGRIAAVQAQGALGLLDALTARAEARDIAASQPLDEALVLQADCLTGVWAAGASRLAGATEELYAQVLRAERRTAERNRADMRGFVGYDPIGTGDVESRAAAYAAGREAARSDVCTLAPAAS